MRRRGAGGNNRLEYITDGLVFHMDGLNKGSNPNYWTDTVGGLQFAYVTGVTPSNNGIVFESEHNPFIRSNTGIDFPCRTHTIEIVCSRIRGMLFFNSSEGQIALGMLGDTLLYGVKYYMAPIPIVNRNIPSCISICDGAAAINGVSAQGSGNVTFWSDDSSNVITIGGRSLRPDYNFVGTIYDIRIYNRKLSIEEMIYNQKIDNDRYSLGILFQE